MLPFAMDHRDEAVPPRRFLLGKSRALGCLFAYDGDTPRLALWLPGGAGASINNAEIHLYDRQGLPETPQKDASGNNVVTTTDRTNVTLSRASAKRTDAKYNFYIETPNEVKLGMTYDTQNPDSTLMVSRQGGSVRAIVPRSGWWGNSLVVERKVARPWGEWIKNVSIADIEDNYVPSAAETSHYNFMEGEPRQVTVSLNIDDAQTLQGTVTAELNPPNIGTITGQTSASVAPGQKKVQLKVNVTLNETAFARQESGGEGALALVLSGKRPASFAVTPFRVTGIRFYRCDTPISEWGNPNYYAQRNPLDKQYVNPSDKAIKFSIAFMPAIADKAAYPYPRVYIYKYVDDEAGAQRFKFRLNDEWVRTELAPSRAELWVTVANRKLRSIGILEEAMDDDTANPGEEFTAFEDTLSSNVNDGERFLLQMKQRAGTQERVSTWTYPKTWGPDPSVAFFKTAGSKHLGLSSQQGKAGVLFQDQADVLYFSGHGLPNACIPISLYDPDAQTNDIRPIEDILLPGHWLKDLDTAIIAACSVLDIDNVNGSFNHPDYFPYRSLERGRLWMQTGPELLLGYHWKAPLDDNGGSDPLFTAKIVTRYFELLSQGESEPLAWIRANSQYATDPESRPWNACAIDMRGAESTYYYWRKIPGGYDIAVETIH